MNVPLKGLAKKRAIDLFPLPQAAEVPEPISYGELRHGGA